jgi:hypothetical protein
MTNHPRSAILVEEHDGVRVYVGQLAPTLSSAEQILVSEAVRKVAEGGETIDSKYATGVTPRSGDVGTVAA